MALEQALTDRDAGPRPEPQGRPEAAAEAAPPPQPAPTPASEAEALGTALLTAQRFGDRLLDEAREEAARITSEAEAKAREILGRAEFGGAEQGRRARRPCRSPSPLGEGARGRTRRTPAGGCCRRAVRPPGRRAARTRLAGSRTGRQQPASRRSWIALGLAFEAEIGGGSGPTPRKGRRIAHALRGGGAGLAPPLPCRRALAVECDVARLVRFGRRARRRLRRSWRQR